MLRTVSVIRSFSLRECVVKVTSFLDLLVAVASRAASEFLTTFQNFAVVTHVHVKAVLFWKFDRDYDPPVPPPRRRILRPQ